jgi:hypothetical protein
LGIPISVTDVRAALLGVRHVRVGPDGDSNNVIAGTTLRRALTQAEALGTGKAVKS